MAYIRFKPFVFSLVLLCVCLCCETGFAGILNLDSAVGKFDLRDHVEVLQDQGWTIDQVSSESFSDRFHKPGPTFCPGQDPRGYWMRFSLESAGGVAANSWFLRVVPPQPRVFVLYQKDGTGDGARWKRWDAGDDNERRGLWTGEIFSVTRLDATDADLREYYIFYKTDDAFYAPVQLLDLMALIRSLGFRLGFIGVCFGFALALILYNGFLYAILRDSSYLYYIMNCTCLTLYFTGAYDLPVDILNVSSKNSLIYTFFTLYLFVFASAQFVRHFLNTKETFPRYDKLLILLAIVGIAMAFSSFVLTPGMSSMLGGCIGLAMSSLYITLGVKSWRNGFTPAKYYLISWSLFLGVSIVYSLANLGIIPFSLNILHGFHASNLAEMLLLSMALASRIRVLRRDRDMAEARDQARSQFLATMSHEIRTPMNAIMGMSEMAMRTEMTREQERLFSTVNKASGLLLAVIDDILDISRVESGRIKLDHVDFDLPGLVRSCVDIISIQAEAKGLGLEVEMSDTVPDWVKGDPLRLKQVLLNLLGNAVKYTQEGRIRVSVRTLAQEDGGSDMVEVSVIDSGVGIPAGEQKRVFERFYQADGPADHVHGGTGLGLAISKSLVALMGGGIQVKSEVGRGSEFTVALPLEAGEPTFPPSHGASASSGAGQDSSGLSILVAEDNHMNVMLMECFLEDTPHQMTTVVNGKKALEALKTSRFDLVLMDLQMPVMDGIEATRRIRAGESGDGNVNIPIVAMSAHVLDAHREKSLAAGVDMVLPKPVSLEALGRALVEIGRERSG